MTPKQVLDKYGAQQGWNDASKLAICLTYIENQAALGYLRPMYLEPMLNGDNSAFAEFVEQQAKEENHPS